IAAMNTDSEAKYGKSFAKLSNKQQVELMTAYDQAAFGDGAKDGLAALDFYPEFKESSCWAFCTSEKGATEHLQFVFDPRGYTNCVPIEEVGGKGFVTPR
ncbi:MAG: gluconate 2-dehydrogenase subunit 3 family protein, partial [Bacteroidota bacterium]